MSLPIRRAVPPLVVACLSLALAASATAAPRPGGYDGQLVRVGQDGNQIVVALTDLPGQRTFAAPNEAARDVLRHAEPGDHVRLQVDDVTAPSVITAVDEVTRPVGFTARVETFLVVTGLMLAVVAAAARGNPLSFVLGKDNRYSNSKMQLAMWFGALALVYVSTLWLRFEWLGPDFIGGVGVTSNVVALTGLSAFAYGGAKAITTQKVARAERARRAPGAPTPHPAPHVAPAETPALATQVGPLSSAVGSPPTGAAPHAAASPDEPNLLIDFFQNAEGDTDLGDLQMILVAVAAVVIFAMTSFHFLAELPLKTSVMLPDVDSALLAGFGIGQGAYLAKKAAMPLGKG